MANVLITGSSRGIGAATIALLRERGARVVGHGRREGPDQVAADLSRPGAGEALWETALAKLGGRIDVLINNAGVFEDAPVDLEAADWRAAWGLTLQTNLQAPADLCRLAVRHFQDRGGGRIVNVASRAAYRGDSPAHWHYAASKGGLVAMTKSIARAYAAEKIYAFSVCPGFVMTGDPDEYLASRGGLAKVAADIPLGRPALPDEVATTSVFLALDAPAAMTGAVVDINGASFVR